jgi:hypothetical protein
MSIISGLRAISGLPLAMPHSQPAGIGLKNEGIVILDESRFGAQRCCTLKMEIVARYPIACG